MSLPNAPVEGGGSKLSFMVYDNAGTNAAALSQAIKTITVNSEIVGWLGVGSHLDGASDGGSEALELVAGSDGTNVLALLTDSAGRLTVVGSAAHGSAASSNPLQMGGVYDASDPALDDGDAGSILLDVAGRVKVAGAGADDAAVVGNPFVIAGVYQATPDEVDDGDAARVRLSVRRGIVTVADQEETIVANGVSIVDTSNHDYDFNITKGWRELSIQFSNTHDQPADITLMGGKNGTPTITLFSETSAVGASSGILLIGSALAAGGSSNYRSAPALSIPLGTLRVRVGFGIAPVSGAITVTVIARS